MTPDLARAVLTVLGFLGSTTVIIALVRLVFFFGQFVEGQKALVAQAEDAAKSFKQFADRVDTALEECSKSVLEIQVEKRVRAELEKSGGTRRRSDMADMPPGSDR